MGLVPTVIYWVEQAAEIKIHDGICSCQIVSGETVIEVRARVPILLKSMGNGARAFACCLGQREADVLPLIERRNREH